MLMVSFSILTYYLHKFILNKFSIHCEISISNGYEIIDLTYFFNKIKNTNKNLNYKENKTKY